MSLRKPAILAFCFAMGLLLLCPNDAIHAQKPKIIKGPVLNVPIPGLEFAQFREGEFVDSPWLSQYVSAIYRYVAGISAVAAGVMIMYGGFLYLIGGTTGQIQKGKTYISGAIIGLILILGASVILNVTNPELTKLSNIEIRRIRPEVTSYMSGRFDAAQNLREVGVTPTPPDTTPSTPSTPSPTSPTTPRAPSSLATNLTIPRGECPGRNPGYLEEGQAKFESLGGQLVTRRNYTISCRGRQLDDKIIDFYIEEQERTGVPAAAIMAQIVTEAGRCAVFDLAEGRPQNVFFNFGGIGCTQAKVPQGSCAHVAYTSRAFDVRTKEPKPVGCQVHNGAVAPACVSLCPTGGAPDCGPDCYPQQSHASAIRDGREIWIPSIQCSRKFDTPQDFLNAHLGFVRFCLPYNDSAYKFAYCIGASTYAGTTGAKGIALAMIIDRNCLCDPETDSTGCQRDSNLEQNLARNIYKKRNLNLFVKFDEDQRRIPDYDTIVKELTEATQGSLQPRVPNVHTPQDDFSPPSE